MNELSRAGNERISNSVVLKAGCRFGEIERVFTSTRVKEDALELPSSETTSSVAFVRGPPHDRTFQVQIEYKLMKKSCVLDDQMQLTHPGIEKHHNREHVKDFKSLENDGKNEDKKPIEKQRNPNDDRLG